MNIFRRLNLYSGLPKSIYTLFIIRIINAFGNFVYPFLTLFLTEKLGMSTARAGTYIMWLAVAGVPGILIGGKLSDHFGRKKLIIIFQGLAALCYIPCIFLGNSSLVPLLIILSSTFGSAVQPASSAMLADLTDRNNRKQAFSLLYLGVNVGFSIGPMVAGLLYRDHTSWIFIGNAASLLISELLLILFVQETLPSKEEMDELSENLKDDESADTGSLLSALVKRPTLLMFISGKTINQFVYSTIGFAIPIQLAQVFGADLGPKNFGILMSFTGLVVLVFTMPITRATVSVRPITNMIFAGIFYALGFGMLGYISIFALYLVSGLIFTIGEILEATSSGVYIANHSPVSHRGRFNSIVPIVTGAGSAIGPYFTAGS